TLSGMGGGGHDLCSLILGEHRRGPPAVCEALHRIGKFFGFSWGGDTDSPRSRSTDCSMSPANSGFQRLGAGPGGVGYRVMSALPPIATKGRTSICVAKGNKRTHAPQQWQYGAPASKAQREDIEPTTSFVVTMALA